MREFLRCAAACRGSRTTTDALLRRGRLNGAACRKRHAFDALSSNNLNASESDYTAKKNPNPRSYDGWSQACLFDCLHANEAYARCEACSPIFALYDRRCAFGGLNIRLISLILSMIVANPAFSEKQVIRNAARASIPHSVCRNAARV